MAEEWRAVVGWNGLYVVSDFGRVRSIDRTYRTDKGRMWSVTGRVLVTTRDTGGYPTVKLHRNNYGKSFGVHRLVAIAFLGAPTVGRDHVNHKNGTKIDNRAANLEWVSQAENNAHAHRLGLASPPPPSHGERHGMAKLTDAQASEILRRRRRGERLAPIAKDYGVSIQTVSRIGVGTHWRHISIAGGNKQ